MIETALIVKIGTNLLRAKVEKPMMEKLLTIAELAGFLDVHPWTIRNWFKLGKIRAYGAGRILRFDKCDVLRSLDLNANPMTGSSLKNRLRQKAPTK